MSWSASGFTSFLPTATLLSALNNATALNFSSDTTKIALFSNTVTPTPDTAAQAYNVAPWNANEVNNGGGNWPVGGPTLGSPTLANTTGQGGVLSYTASNVSAASVTIAAARGALIYDSTISSLGIAAIYFGGDFTSTVGTFAITWGTANGVSSTVWWISTV